MTWPGYDDGRPRCTCGPAPRGPPWDDGADNGACTYCEAVREGRTDEDFAAMVDGDPPTLDELEDGAWPPGEGDCVKCGTPLSRGPWGFVDCIACNPPPGRP